MNVMEKNKILEERVEELLGEIDRMGIEVRNMKVSNGGRHGESETNELQILKEDNVKSRSRIVKDKEKGGRVEQEIKVMKEELMALKLKASNN